MEEDEEKKGEKEVKEELGMLCMVFLGAPLTPHCEFELWGQASWRVVEQCYPRLQEGGRKSYLCELLRKHRVPVDLLHDVLRLE